MTIKKKVLLLGTALLAVTSLSAQAAVIKQADLDLNTNYLTIEGLGFENNDGSYATIFVTKAGKTIDDIVKTGNSYNDSQADKSVEKQDQVEIKDGKFRFNFPLNNPANGTYTAYIKAGGKSLVSTFNYTGTLADNVTDILVDGRAEASEVAPLADGLNLNNTAYADIDNKAVALAMVENMTGIINPEALKDAVAKASLVQALNEGKTAPVFDGTKFINPDVLGLDTLDANKGIKAYEQYTTQLSEAGREAVIAAISNKNYNSYDEFITDFVLQTTINAIKRNINNGTDHISTALTDNNAVNGLTFTNYNANQSAINALLMSEPYSTKEQLQAVLNTAISSDDNTTTTKPETSRPSQTTNGTTFAPTITVKDGVEEFVFADVTENYSWARDAIKELYEAGIISGKSSNTFAPADEVTRAEFLKILMGVVEIEAENGTSEFNDVNAFDWYHDYVVTATKLGLVNGISETEFGANNNITRQDACVMIARACQIAGKALSAGTAKEFEDADFVSDYAKESVDLLSGAGIVQGSNNRFLPRGYCTRAEAAVMLKNVLDKIEG